MRLSLTQHPNEVNISSTCMRGKSKLCCSSVVSSLAVQEERQRYPHPELLRRVAGEVAQE